MDAARLRRDLALADGQERSPGPRPRDVAGRRDEERPDHHDQVIAGSVRRQCPGAEVPRRHVEAVVAAREPVEVQDRLDHDEAEGERGHRQVESLEPQARDAERQAHRGGAEAGRQERRRKGQPRRTDRQDRGRIGADRQEARVAEGELIRVARQEVQPDGDDRVDDDQARQEDEIARRGPRPAEHHHGAGRDRGAAHQTFRRATRPTTPPGRTIRIVIMTRNGTECLMDAGR